MRQTQHVRPRAGSALFVDDEIVVRLPPPVIQEHDGFLVVRDDLLPGGTKRRAMHVFFNSEQSHYVYASPVYGHAQLALAYAARDYGKLAHVFCAKRKIPHPLTVQAHAVGALIHEVPNGYLTVVTARAREYCHHNSWKLLPFGLDDPTFIDTLADVARALPVQPKEVWSISSSGVLTRALQQSWPNAQFFGIRVGAEPNAGKATVLVAPEQFSQDARILPPFPSNLNYDAKAWRFIKEQASKGALFWNVA